MKVRARDAIAAGTVWLPLLIGSLAWLSWRDELPAEVTLRNDVAGGVAPTLPMWALVAAVSPPDDPSRANALLGFATIGAGLYGLMPFFIAHRPERMSVDA